MRRRWGVLVGGALALAVGRAPAALAQQAIAVGERVSGSLGPGDETLRSGEFADAFVLQGRAGQRITLRLRSSAFDAYLLVRGPSGFTQDNDDDVSQRGSRDARLDLSLPSDGAYRIVATSYSPGERGAYQLSVEGGGGTAAAAPAPAPAAGGTVSLGQSVAGRLEPGDGRLTGGEWADRYAFAGTRGQRLEIRLASSAFDPYVAIRGAGGFTAFNDDDVNGGTTGSRLVVTLPADGAYEIVATSYAPGETGPYQLSVAGTGAVVAGAGAAVDAADLVLGRPVTGTLAVGDDTLPSGEFVDRYRFSGASGQRLAIDLTASAFDAYALLIAPSGRQEENDDAITGATDSRLETVLSETGTYTILATSYRRGETGGYRIAVNPLGAGGRAAAAGGAAAVPAPPGAVLAAGASVTGRLEAGDATLASGEFVDRYAFDGQRGQVVTIAMTSSELDAYLLVTAPGGAQQENDDASASDRNARVTWALPETGRYTVQATSYRPGERGGYALGLTRGTGPVNAAATPPPAGPSRGAAGRQRVWAVAVGISAYGGAASDLPYTADDAVKIAETLRRAGVLADGSVVLTDGDATVGRVRAAFERVARQAGPDDVFLFFYSGHGTQLPVDRASSEPDQREEAIVLRDGMVTDDELGRWFGLVRSRMAIVALDACFSGGFARDVVTRPGIMGLFSSEEDLTSAVAGKFQAGGYLAHFLRSALAGEADQDRNGQVTAGELSSYLRRQFATQAAEVEAVTSERQRNYQFLVIDRGGVKIDDVVLALR